MGRRLANMLVGFAIGLVFFLTLEIALHKPFALEPALVGAFSCGTLSVWIAERKGKVKSIEEINRPLTLFPPVPSDKENSK